MQTQKEPSFFILFLLISFASVSAVLFTPALPEITQKFNITTFQAQLTMTLFLVGYALGNLPYGPFSNRFGRKPAIYLGASLAIVGCFVIIIAGALKMLWLFLLGRFLSALGSSVGMKISFTMIADVYELDKATKKISLAMIAFAITPGLGIALGGFLTGKFGWESCFYFLAGYSLLILVLSYFLPETCKKLDKQALNIDVIKEGYLKKLKNKKVVTGALIMGTVTSNIYIFVTLAPFLGIEYIGLSAEEYGLLNFIPPLGMIVGSLLSQHFAGKKDPFIIMLAGIILASVSALSMLLLFFINDITAWTLFLPMPFIYIGLSPVLANASAYALANAQNKSIASSLINFINLMLCVIALSFAEALPAGWVYSMPILFLVLISIMSLLRRRLVIDRKTA